jgi:uncharacterized membrane protein HdeD (DUF308 family)
MGIFFKLKTNFFVNAVILVVVGMVLIFLPGTTLNILTKAIGILIAIAGVVAVVNGFIAKEQNLITKNSSLGFGIIIAVVGIWMVMNPTFFEKIIPVIAGVIMLFSGAMNLGEALSLGKSKYNRWWVALILAVITVGMGAFLLLRPLESIGYVVKLIGGALVYNGVSNLWIISRIHKVDKVVRGEIVDVESKEL